MRRLNINIDVSDLQYEMLHCEASEQGQLISTTVNNRIFAKKFSQSVIDYAVEKYRQELENMGTN